MSNDQRTPDKPMRQSDKPPTSATKPQGTKA